MKYYLNVKLIIFMALLSIPNAVKADIQRPPVYEQLIINLLQPAIQEKMNEYYGEELISQVHLYNYEMSILEMKAEAYESPTVTLKFTPMIGAHNPVADYEVIFSVGNVGEIELLSFKQLNVYPETLSRFHLTLPEIE